LPTTDRKSALNDFGRRRNNQRGGGRKKECEPPRPVKEMRLKAHRTKREQKRKSFTPLPSTDVYLGANGPKKRGKVAGRLTPGPVRPRGLRGRRGGLATGGALVLSRGSSV